jgi:MFS-type transporter involved in bile tolerance (Atg22 family)
VLAILVIVFAWLPYSWSKIVLTILGALLAILAIVGTCCCSTMSEQAKSETSSKAEQ